MIWFTSDLHLCHDRQFVYKARGFDTVDEMNEALVNNINDCVKEGDTLYILGDLGLGQDTDKVVCLLNRIKCKEIYIIRGNHDTDSRLKEYVNSFYNLKGIYDAKYLRYGKYHLYLSHYPTMTGNLEKEALTQMTLNLYGHTHQKSQFYNDIPYMFHVGADSNNNRPVNVDFVLKQMKLKMEECKYFL